jgi:BarA-like signal transduction histidine kinase
MFEVKYNLHYQEFTTAKMNTEHKNKLEVDSKTVENISLLCSLAGLETPEVITSDFIETAHKRIKEVLLNLKKQADEGNSTTEKLSEQIKELNNKINDLKKQLSETKKAPAQNDTTNNSKETQKDTPKETETRELKPPGQIQDILIIANLGVIMHQLKILFSKSGCKVTLVKNYSEAIGELKDRSYDCILFDMSTTTENDMMVIEALRKATKICHSNTLIMVLTVPSREKKLFDKLKSRGADIIVEKHESWHMNILKELKLVS